MSIKALQLIRVKHPTNVALSPCVATIGNFDGCHLGHQRLIKAVVAKAKSLNLVPTLITFEPMPQHFFKPTEPLLKLTPLLQKLKILHELGIERVILLKFNKEFSELSAEKFIEQYIVNHFKVKHLIVGDNFRFGHRQTGDIILLNKYASVLDFTCTTIALDGTKPISSTLIRQSLLAGDCKKACNLLGRPFQITARVIKGKRLGSQWGIPTANLPVHVSDPNFKGIFVVKVNVDGIAYSGVASLGIHPTFNDKKYSLEAHLFDFNGDLYGKRLNVELLYKLRDELHFSSLETLRQFIIQDIHDAKEYLKLNFTSGH